MSKAEEATNDFCTRCFKYDRCTKVQSECTMADSYQEGYEDGYHQAEKDLELTWEERLIYIVMKSTGHYEDRFESPYKAFTDKEKAERLVKEKNDYYSDLDSRYMKIDIDVQTKLEEMFARYLQDTDKEMYEAYQEVIKHEDWIEDVEDTFDWDEFYDKQNDFKEDKALVSKYIKICGLTDKERDAIFVYLEYEENSQYHDGLPYFYVSRNVLKLEE